MYYDPAYLLFALPGLVLGLIATASVRSTFSRYADIPSSSGLTGAEAADRMLEAAGVGGVRIEMGGGFLTDNYNPLTRTLRLSPGVFRGRGLSSIGVACHEAGHAIQQATRFAPLTLRTALVPVTNVASTLSYFVVLLGFLWSPRLILWGALLFGVAVLFSLMTLPVEWDASRRAGRLMESTGIVDGGESREATSVLRAAFLTYVAGLVSAVFTFLYYLMRAGAFRRRD